MVKDQTIGVGYTKTNQKDDNNPDDYELNEQSERFNIFTKIKLPEEYIKLFDFEFDLFWTKTKVPSGTMFGDKGTAWANLGFSKKLMDNKLILSFTIDNLFDSGGFQMNRTKPVPSYFYNTGTANGQIQDSMFEHSNNPNNFNQEIMTTDQLYQLVRGEVPEQNSPKQNVPSPFANQDTRPSAVKQAKSSGSIYSASTHTPENPPTDDSWKSWDEM